MNNATHVFTPRQEIYDYFAVFRVSQLILVIAWAFIYPLELWGIIEIIRDWKNDSIKMTRDRQTKFLRIFLFGNSCANMICFTSVAVIAWHESLSPLWCDVADRIACVCYCFAVQFGYLFLLQKAKLVGSFEKGKVYKWLSYLCEAGVATMVPLGLLPMVIITFRGVVSFEGLCIQHSDAWSVWFFVVANTFLTMVMMYLFVKPLLTSAASMKSGTQHELSKTMIAVARRNAVLAITAVTFTLVTCSVMAAATEVANREGMLYEHYRVLGLTIIPWDMFVLGTTCRLTTSIWLPNRVSRALGLTRGGSLIDANSKVSLLPHVTGGTVSSHASSPSRVQSNITSAQVVNESVNN